MSARPRRMAAFDAQLLGDLIERRCLRESAEGVDDSLLVGHGRKLSPGDIEGKAREAWPDARAQRGRGLSPGFAINALRRMLNGLRLRHDNGRDQVEH